MIQAGARRNQDPGARGGKGSREGKGDGGKLAPDVLLKCSLRNGFCLNAGWELPISGNLHRTDLPKMNNVACVCIYL